MKVAAVEGEKGAVMELNALGLRPAAAAAVTERGELPLRRCLPPRGERRGACGASAVATSSSSPCRALPGGRDSAAKILSSGAAVFTSGLAVRHFAEVGGPQAVKELAKKEK
jgi:hypothetical protein